MKYALTVFVFIFPLVIGTVCGCLSVEQTDNIDGNGDPMKSKIAIRVGSKTFLATLLDNESADMFKAMLPLTMDMTELNGNEKYFRFDKNLPTDASNPGTINSGDLMLWGANTLVLFYKTFPTSYSYTKIGKIENPAGLAAALGSGNVMVTFDSE